MSREGGRRSRKPASAALLVDHPAIPVPVVAAGGVRGMDPDGVSLHTLSRRDRLRCAVQLTSLCAVLADFDLWPGVWTLRAARAVVGGDGVQVRLGGFPSSLTYITRRLGGGEAAALALRDGLIRAVCRVAGLEVPEAAGDGRQPGFFLGPFLSRLMERLPGPVDRQSANNLWACRWDLPPLPAEGEVAYWSVAREDVALRLGSAMVLGARDRGAVAHLRWIQDVEADTAPTPGLGMRGTLVLAGKVIEDDLTTLEKWVAEEGRSAVVFGSFPPGWSPPQPPGFDSSRLARHLSITGVSLETGQAEVDRREGHFDPLVTADREALTTTLIELVGGDSSASTEPAPATPSPLIQVLQLLPEGLPEGFLAVHAGFGADELRRQADPMRVVAERGWWRLATAAPLRPDALHADVAGLFQESDPRRLRHLALASGKTAELLAWCRQRLDDLDGRAVRDLLSDLAPGVLGPQVHAALAEACLAEYDLGGSRRAVQLMDEADRAPWSAWIEVLDRARTAPQTELPEQLGATAARAFAEVLLARFRSEVSRGDLSAAATAEDLRLVVAPLSGALAKSFEIRTVAISDPERLKDKQWRRQVTGNHPGLKRILWHKYAIELDRTGDHRRSRRLLDRLARVEETPGRMGLLHIDLGNVIAALGLRREGERHHLKAYRLLQAAGFRHRTRTVVFNLAVGDLDRLQVERARQRFLSVHGGESDLFALCEEARLALAVGDEEGVRTRLERAPALTEVGDLRFVEALAFLHGVLALLAGETARAEELLERGGDEGRDWRELAAALVGSPIQVDRDDGWGVSLAARAVQTLRRSGPEAVVELLPKADPTVDQAFALALVERLAGRQSWLSAEQRAAAADRLSLSGLTGWAQRMRSPEQPGDAFVPALAELVDCAEPESMDDAMVAGLLGAIGLTGLEVRTGAERQLIWRWGGGRPSAEVNHGHLVLVPLGNEPAPGEHWRLLGSLLGLLLPKQALLPTTTEDETGLTGSSRAIDSVRLELRRFAASPVAVLILGETGVGKDVAANALHRLSGRKGQFQAVNVAAIPDSLLESELFGSVKGAYTGADRSRQGLVEAADGGTLFLDEIGDLSLPLQVKLLRFLESHEVRPVGATRAHTVDVRIVSATHRDLKTRVANGSFREDLYYRIASAPIRIPPLRERREDIPMLRDYFQDQVIARDGLAPPRWSREAEGTLLNYDWPGNVRQLRQVVDVALIRAAGRVVSVEHLDISAPSTEVTSGTWEEATRQFRRKLLQATLERNGGNRSAAARELGISRQALLYHLKKLALK